MTCIVAVEDKEEGRVWIGGDASAVDDTHDSIRVASPKVFTIGNLVMGTCGTFCVGQALQFSLTVVRDR